jgi:hypothetical protein
MKSILALDLGTTMGWAARTVTGVIVSGTYSLKGGRFEGGGARYLRFDQWLHNLWVDPWTGPYGPLGACYYEEVRRHLSTDSAHIYGGLLAILQASFESSQTPYIGVPVGTIKKHATGKGNANKQAMIQAARDRGHKPEDDNEADALCLLYWAIEQEAPPPA